MNSYQRVFAALNHEEPDRIPLDLGGSAVTGISAAAVYLIRQALELDPPRTPVKITEPYQMLGEVAPDLQDALGVDVVGLAAPRTMFGFSNENWKEWDFNGTPVLVPEAFNTAPEPDGSLLMYPEGDPSAPPSGRMPAGGFYFDAIVRQPPIDEARLDPEDNLQEFSPISEADLDWFASEFQRLCRESERAILASFGGTGFGDIALVPAPWIKYPRGIRDITEWYLSTVTRREYVWKVFERQCEIALANWEKILERLKKVGEVGRIAAVLVTGTDFGTQIGPFLSPKVYRDLFKPFHKEVNDWVHRRTPWKTFIHSCGSISAFIPDFLEAGFDILNPVQTTAANMDARMLKRRFGERITFWGGGVDTQHTLPFGTPEMVRLEVRERIKIFRSGGGFVFSPVHNIQALVPAENLVAMIKAIQDYR